MWISVFLTEIVVGCSVGVYSSVFVCVCVCERERKGEGEKGHSSTYFNLFDCTDTKRTFEAGGGLVGVKDLLFELNWNLEPLFSAFELHNISSFCLQSMLANESKRGKVKNNRAACQTMLSILFSYSPVRQLLI